MQNRFTSFVLLLLLPFLIQAQPKIEKITIYSPAEIATVRQQIVDSIWVPGAKTVLPTLTFSAGINPAAFKTEEYPWLGSVGSIDKLKLILKNKIESNVYILHPRVSNRLKIPIIYHGGHGGGFWEDKNWNNMSSDYAVSVYKFFLDHGFDVVCIDLPLHGVNEKSYMWDKQTGKYLITEHGDLFKLKEPFYYFFEPIKRTIDFLQKRFGYSEFAMIGLSGGGWATTVYSAIDTRIKHSYAIAGSTPLDFRTHPNDWGDLEQNYKPFYDQFNYSTLYTLAAAGEDRLHYQILLKNDQCCFAVNGEPWAKNVQVALVNLPDPGSYKFLYDTSANKHMVSSVALDSIYNNLLKYFVIKNLPFEIRIANANKDKPMLVCRMDTIVLSNVVPGEDVIHWFRDSTSLLTQNTKALRLQGPGNYFARVTNISGIDISSDTLTVGQFLPPVITRRNGRLYSSARRGNRWYLDGTLLPDLTDDNIQPKKAGIYTVNINAGMCTSQASRPFYYGSLVYPNPASDHLILQFDHAIGQLTVALTDLNGRLILTANVESYKILRFPPTVKKGIYFLKMYNGTGYNETVKVMIQ